MMVQVLFHGNTRYEQIEGSWMTEFWTKIFDNLDSMNMPFNGDGCYEIAFTDDSLEQFRDDGVLEKDNIGEYIQLKNVKVRNLCLF